MPIIFYCRGRSNAIYLRWLLGWLLLAAVGIPAGCAYWILGQETKEFWIGLAFLAGGVGGLFGIFYAAAVLLKPEKGAIGKSVRMQVDPVQAEMDIEELFQIVDQDLTLHGKRFDRIVVGEEWLLGDQVMRLDRLRGAFSIEEGTQRQRRCVLCLVDDQKRTQRTDIWRPKEADALCSYLRIHFPGIATDNYTSFIAQKEQEWESWEREFQSRREEREARQFQEPQDFVFSDRNGKQSSRITWRRIREEQGLLGEGERIWLSPICPIEEDRAQIKWKNTELSAQKRGEQYLCQTVLQMADGERQTFSGIFSKEKTERLFMEYFQQRRAPDLAEWKREIPSKREKKPSSLSSTTPQAVLDWFSAGWKTPDKS